LALFSGSISPWFVLSNNLAMTNTRAIWLCFGAFLSPPASSLQFHWSLATGYWPPFSRPTPHAETSGFRSCADPPPLATAWHQPPICQRANRARSRRGAPLFQYVTKPGDWCGQIDLFLRTHCRTTVDHSGMVQLRVTAIPEVAIHCSSGFSRFRARFNYGRFRVATEANLRPRARFGCSIVLRLIFRL